MLSKGRILLEGRSRYPWETEALQFIREQLPDVDPFAMCELIELADPVSGRLYEIDCLIIGYAALYLMEIKSGPGEYSGDERDWYWTADGRRRYMPPPLALTNQKAKVLKSLLERYMPREIACPWVQPLVFLSHREVKHSFQGAGGQCVVTRQNLLRALKFHDLPGVSGGRRPHPINKPQQGAVAQALRAMGVRESEGARRVGSFKLGSVVEEGPGYEDREAVHAERETTRRRARIYLVPQQTSLERRQTLLRAADREAALLEDVKEHPGVLRITDYVPDCALGPAVLFDYFDGVPLDAFLRHHPNLGFDARVQIVRQVGLAVAHCHKKQVVHGGLCPRAVLVQQTPEGSLETRLYNFQLGGSEAVSGTVHWASLAALPWSAYQAPELREDPLARQPVADAFSLGALAFFVLTGKPPGQNGREVDQLLLESKAHELDPRMVDDTIPPKVAEAIGFATQLKAISRADDVSVWLHDWFLDAATRPEPELSKPQTDPLEAHKKDLLENGLQVESVLGQGASSRVLHLAGGSDPREAALKIALTEDDAARLEAEAKILEQLHHGNIVQFYKRCTIAGRACLLMALAGRHTLSRELSQEGALSLDYAARYGEELLLALRELENERILHRDIKPGNIGVGTPARRSYRLTLFDFSLGIDLKEPHPASPPLNQIGIGTTVYRDPFLRLRGAWDHAADRWSAAVTLHEMLTTVRPSFEPSGSPALDPEARLVLAGERFDATVRSALIPFFERALHRDIQHRFDSAESMRKAWNRAFEVQRRAITPVPAALSVTITGAKGNEPSRAENAARSRSAPPATSSAAVVRNVRPLGEADASGAAPAAAGAVPAAAASAKATRAEATPLAPVSAEIAATEARRSAPSSGPAQTPVTNTAASTESESAIIDSGSLISSPGLPDLPPDLSPKTPIASLPLTPQALSALDRAGLRVAEELLRLPDNQLSAVRGVGRKVAVEILKYRDACRGRLSAATAPACFAEGYVGDDLPLASTDLPAGIARVMSDAGLDSLRKIALAPANQVEALLVRSGQSVEPLQLLLKELHEQTVEQEQPTHTSAWFQSLLPKQQQLRQELAVLFGVREPLLGEFEAPLGRAARALGVSSASLSAAFTKATEHWAKHPLMATLRGFVHKIVDAAGLGLPVREAARLLLDILGQKPCSDSPSHAGSEVVAKVQLAEAAALVRMVAAVEQHQAQEQEGEGQEGERLSWTRVGEVPWVLTHPALAHPALAELIRELGRAADELAGRQVLASPAEVLRVLQARVEETALATLSDDALTTLAARASDRAARSSRLELYPKGLSARRALELSSSALTGELSPERVESLVFARYPEAEPLPPRPELDRWLEPLGLGWNPDTEKYGRPEPNFATRGTSHSRTRLPSTLSARSSVREIHPQIVEQQDFEERLRGAVQERRLRVVSVTKSFAAPAALAMAEAFDLCLVNLDELLIARLRAYVKAEHIDEENVFGADAAGPDGDEWSLLSDVMREVSAAVARDLFPVKQPTLLVQPGLLARFQLSSFLSVMAAAAENPQSAACLLLVPDSDSSGLPLINGTLPVPVTGSADVIQVPGSWIRDHQRAA